MCLNEPVMGIVSEVLGHRLVRVMAQLFQARFGTVEFRPVQKLAPDPMPLLCGNYRDVLDKQVVSRRLVDE